MRNSRVSIGVIVWAVTVFAVAAGFWATIIWPGKPKDSYGGLPPPPAPPLALPLTGDALSPIRPLPRSTDAVPNPVPAAPAAIPAPTVPAPVVVPPDSQPAVYTSPAPGLSADGRICQQIHEEMRRNGFKGRFAHECR